MKHTKRIQKYLDGELNEEEKKLFSEELQIDPELIQEFDLHLLIDATIVSKDEERFRKKLDEAYKVYKIKTSAEIELKEAGKKIINRRNGLIAVSFGIVIFLAGYFIWFAKESNYSIFKKNLISYNIDLGSRRSITENDKAGKLELGIEKYYKKNYSDASQIFNGIIMEMPENATAQFFNGLCYLYLDDFNSAIKSFENVNSLPFNYYQEYAIWYLALCHIRTNNNDTARVILNGIIEEDGFFSARSKKILKKLK